MSQLLTPVQSYTNYISENADLFTEPTAPLSIINENATFSEFKDTQLNTIQESDTHTRTVTNKILDRQREFLLEESSSLFNSAEAVSYAVSTFPILTDIYAEPLLNKIITVFPYNKPVLTIPRQKWITKIVDEKGNVENIEFPTVNKSIRPNFKTINVKRSDNMYTICDISSAAFGINQRNYKVTSLTVSVAGTDTVVPVYGAPDAKGSIVIDDVEIDAGVFQILGQVNFENGQITWSLIPIEAPASTVVEVDLEVRFRIFGRGNGLACVKARPQMNTLEINCDVEDFFEIENVEEIIQDWNSLYNLDIIAILKDYVKDQMKLNKDMEIADLLQYNISAAKKLGQYRKIDLGAFVTDTNTRPATIIDVFKNIQPVITALIEKIRKNTRMKIQYLVTGIDAASILKSLQEYAMKFDGFEGSTGQTGSLGDFAKLEIISSACIEDNMIHLIPFSESLAQTSILEVTYKPLYIISETTNSIKRFFIKSRNWIGIVRNDAIGTIELAGYAKFFGIEEVV